MDQAEQVGEALNILEELDQRALRIRFYVDGLAPGMDSLKPLTTTDIATSVGIRQKQLWDLFQASTARSHFVPQILNLHEKHGDLLQIEATNSKDESGIAEQLATVDSLSEVILTLASKLRLVSDLSIPPSAGLSSLCSTKPDLATVEELFELLAERVLACRARATGLLQRWYEVAVLADGECLVDWDERLKMIEKAMRLEKSTQEQSTRLFQSL